MVANGTPWLPTIALAPRTQFLVGSEFADPARHRQMLRQGSGHVVNISASVADHADSAEPTALAALTKGGLAAVTRSLAVEYASRGPSLAQDGRVT